MVKLGILWFVPDPSLRAYTVETLDDRIHVLRKLTWEKHGGLKDPRMRQIGLAVTDGCPPRDDMCELRAIFDFIVRNIRYTGDIAGKDTFQTALRTMQYGGGDCDDHSVLAAVLAMENGFTCKWRITSNTGASWDHIYCMAAIPKLRPGGRWIALDTTMGAGKFNRQPPQAKHRDFMVGSL